MKTYKLEDVFKFAIDMEEKGMVFYETVACATEDKRAKDIFCYLREQEIKHARVFGKLYNAYAKKGLSFSTKEEAGEVLDTLLRGLLLPDISEVRDTLAKKKNESLISIIRIAMDIELNTILFYKKFKELISKKEPVKAMNKIIREEEGHLVKLKNLRLDLDPFYAGMEYAKFF